MSLATTLHDKMFPNEVKTNVPHCSTALGQQMSADVLPSEEQCPDINQNTTAYGASEEHHTHL